MVRRRARKWNFKSFRRLGNLFVKSGLRAVPLGLMVVAVCFIFFGVRQMVHADPYFQVERITVFPSGLLNSLEYQFLDNETRNKSLFEVDLKKISKNLEKNPKIKRAEAVRVLPNQLNIFLATRLPLLQVQLQPQGSYYSVAGDQLILSSRTVPRPDLMVLEDFSAQKKSYSIGTLYQNKYFQELFHLLELLKADPLLKVETISKLGMDHLGNVTLVLKDGIEL
ncbi:MAG: FtsQ-type POTRA domain-containing protein, partial [Candidatus Omnitrophica bacterium]|nr:FtsQ-type POTRA domain-containing protein [Candidatus Omnitrophota bacterium]